MSFDGPDRYGVSMVPQLRRSRALPADVRGAELRSGHSARCDR